MDLIYFWFLVVLGKVNTEKISAKSFYSDCGQVYTEKQFIIQSPLYPSNYPLNYECSYLIKGPSCPTNFTLEFLDFQLEHSEGCTKDRLEIDVQDALCGSQRETKHYFTKKGTLVLRFISDLNVTGRGYSLAVSRSNCILAIPESTTAKNWYTTSKDVEYTTTRPRKVIQEKCCQVSYGARRFTLTSPNFPYTMSNPSECIYEIYRASQNICRLRIQIKFFWVGHLSTNCPEGFLEIDGKFICGCKSDLKILSPFENQSKKLIRFVSRSYESKSYSGFVLDVLQEECPKKYTPEINNCSNLPFYNDQINKISWPNHSHKTVVDKLDHINKNTEILEDHSEQQILRHVYYFTAPRDIEQTDYVDTGTVKNLIVEDARNYDSCIVWNRYQLSYLFTTNFPKCKSTSSVIANPKKCVELTQIKGYIRSPGYPFYYPGNLNVCYRFTKMPGYCGFRLCMNDFSLQDSLNCQKDYLMFDNKYRYCGTSLANKLSTIDLRNKVSEELTFISDQFYCGRGFFGVFEQFPCEIPTPLTPSPNPPPACNRIIKDDMFTIEVFDHHSETCTFTIQKSSENVCTLRLTFEQINLFCQYESLLIDDSSYCEQTSDGHSVKIDTREKDYVRIKYRKSSNSRIRGLRVRIKGIQDGDECFDPKIPAERLVLQSDTQTRLSNNAKFLLKINKQFKDVCGIITNSTKTALPKTFCELLMDQDKNISSCLPISSSVITIPLGSEKLQLKILNNTSVEEIEFEEVACNDIQKR